MGWGYDPRYEDSSGDAETEGGGRDKAKRLPPIRKRSTETRKVSGISNSSSKGHLDDEELEDIISEYRNAQSGTAQAQPKRRLSRDERKQQRKQREQARIAALTLSDEKTKEGPEVDDGRTALERLQDKKVKHGLDQAPARVPHPEVPH